MARSHVNGIAEPVILRARARAATALKQWLKEGRFAASEILPTEQTLCDELRVSRGTVRAVLQELENEGLILSQKGPGRLRGRIALRSVATRNSLMDRVIVLITAIPKPMPYVKGGLLYAMDSGAVTAVQEGGLHLFLLHPDAISEGDIDRMIADAPAGVAIASAVADYYVPQRELLLRLSGKVPLVVAGNDDLWAGCDRAISDHEVGMAMLTTWLLQQGKRKILRLWSSDNADSYWIRDRNRSFEKTMQAAGVPILPQVNVTNVICQDELSHEQFDRNVRLIASHLIEYLGRSKPTIDTIMATSDSNAYYVAAACRLFGVRPNEDVWIVGYDNFWPVAPERAFGEFVPKATIDKQNYTVGLKMIEVLRRRIAGELPPEPQCVRVQPELIVPTAE